MMEISKKKFRELLFQIIFSQDFGGSLNITEVLSLLKQSMITKKNLRQVCIKFNKILSKKIAVDTLIAKFSKSYDFNRISRVERNILRLGVFELLFDEDIPPKVAISESIRLSRKYGTHEGGAFVNAILDAIYLGEKSCVDQKSY